MPGSYAPGPGYMDWANRPDPFRRFSGTRMFELPLVRDDGTPSYDALFQFRKTPPRPRTAESLGLFLGLSLGITAWKEFQGTRWSLRANPSSGNLHPTEGYVVLPPLAIEMEAEIESLGDEAVELTFYELGEFDASVVRQWGECVS